MQGYIRAIGFGAKWGMMKYYKMEVVFSDRIVLARGGYDYYSVTLANGAALPAKVAIPVELDNLDSTHIVSGEIFISRNDLKNVDGTIEAQLRLPLGSKEVEPGQIITAGVK